MHIFTLSVVLGLSCVVAKLTVGGAHGSQDLWKADVHRRHHTRRASTSGKCKSKKKSHASPQAAASSSAYTPAASATSAAPSNSSAGSDPTTSSASSDSANLSGITGFLGSVSGIGSWFRTDNSQDSTDGTSWCQLKYQDNWLGFAPSVQTMLDNFGGDLTKAATAYCGLEAKATNPANGNTALIYIVDGFDSQWVRTPDSIDLTLGAFGALYGSTTSDKDIVIQDLQWEFTGNRNSNYAFNAGS